MREQHLEVTRTARYWVLGEPSPSTEQVWFVCHGYRQLAGRFIHRFRCLESPKRVIVAPEGLSRFYIDSAPGPHGPDHRVGASWMTRSDRQAEIRDYVRYLDRLAERILEPVSRPLARVVVLGFSQGVHTATRWTVLGGTPVDALVLWGGYLPPDLDWSLATDRLSAVDLVHVYGTSDATRDPKLKASQDERLSTAGVAFRSLTHPGGHRVDDELLLQLSDEL